MRPRRYNRGGAERLQGWLLHFKRFQGAVLEELVRGSRVGTILMLSIQASGQTLHELQQRHSDRATATSEFCWVDQYSWKLDPAILDIPTLSADPLFRQVRGHPPARSRERRPSLLVRCFIRTNQAASQVNTKGHWRHIQYPASDGKKESVCSRN